MRRTDWREHPEQAIIIAILTFLFTIACTGLVLAQDRGEAHDPFASGGLILRGKGATQELPALRLGTDISAKVTGNVARVTVTQAFRNTSNDWMEGTYLFPLPDDGAVDDLKMVVGDRILIGHIRAREEAREIYETAMREGRQAGLVEQARPNMFRTNVANVAPGETVLIAIQFQAPVRQLGGEYALRLPLVVGPRFISPTTVLDAEGNISEEGLRDAARVTAPTLAPDVAEGMNPVSITVDLAPGFVPAQVDSPYHAIDITAGAGNTTRVTLTQGEVPADRDFELRWRAAGNQPALGLFRQTFDGKDYVMATITPPSQPQRGTIPPREMIFVIDNSGSMSGASMDAARRSLIYALGTLRPQDQFNVIRFDDTMTQLFDEAVPASREQVRTAHMFASGLHAGGGTDMLPALRAALVDPQSARTIVIRQVIFLTDGSLSDEQAMMREIEGNRGRSRVFMVGIGSAPNNYLMRRMAEAGRGTYANIGYGDEVQDRMRDFLDRLAAPVAHDLSISLEGGAIEFTPEDLPDLYAGEPLVLISRADEARGRLTVSGTLGGRRWSQTVNLAEAQESDAVARLWARRRVGEIEAARWSGETDYEEAGKQIAALGIAFHIVTEETSLIAEDETPRRPPGVRLRREELPLLLPHGWDFEHLFGHDGSGEPVDPATAGDSEAVQLPKTAALWSGQLQAGLLVLLLGIMGLAASRRRKEFA